MSITKKEVRTSFLKNQNEETKEQLLVDLKKLKKAANVIRYFSIKKEVTEIEGQTAYLEKNLQEWTNKHCQHNLLYFMPQRQSYINPEPATDEFRCTCIDCGLILNLPESELSKKHIIKSTTSFGEVAEYYRNWKKVLINSQIKGHEVTDKNYTTGLNVGLKSLIKSIENRFNNK